jgi:glutathione S-transferase
MTDLILHSYDGSPFTQRVLKMLAIKRARWRWVETPMMLPKEDLVALTGGYRGTPVLQIGADVYIDSQRIARELENRIAQPTLFPGGGVGLDYAMVKWADAFFRAGLHMAIGLTSPAWPEEFRADRQKLFPDIDFAKVDVEHAQSQLRAHAEPDRSAVARRPRLPRRRRSGSARHTCLDGAVVRTSVDAGRQRAAGGVSALVCLGSAGGRAGRGRATADYLRRGLCCGARCQAFGRLDRRR